MKIIFNHREDLTDNIASLFFIKTKDFIYDAGQYSEFSFNDESTELNGGNRWFTFSSSPTEEFISITIRHSKKNSTFKEKLLSLKPNDTMNISSAIGDFVLPIDKTIPLVFITGGIGVTPVISIIKYLLDKNENRNISLIFFAKSEKELIFNDLFIKYKLEYITIVSNKPNVNKLKKIHLIKAFKSNTQFYISGPQTMVETIANDLVIKYSQQQVIMDYFPGYTDI